MTRRIAWAWVAVTWLACLWLLTGCAHTPVPPGEPCRHAGWIESRQDECDVWRCNAATLRWERLEVCE
jgi:hypothetical protein